jgi:hypothetical protein
MSSPGGTPLDLPGGFALHLTSPPDSRDGTDTDRPYLLIGTVTGPGLAEFQGGSARVRSLTTGLAVEAYLDANGSFTAAVELTADEDNGLEIDLCDPAGREVARVRTVVRHRSVDRPFAEQPAIPPPAETQSVLDPPWPRFAKLVRDCLDRAATVADRTGRNRQELFEHVYTQERYAEQAHADNNAALYGECWQNLEQYAAYLEQLLEDALPRPPRVPSLPPEEQARADLERFRSYLAEVWKKVRGQGRADLDARLVVVARQAQGLNARARAEPLAVPNEVRRLAAEIEKVERELAAAPPA